MEGENHEILAQFLGITGAEPDMANSFLEACFHVNLLSLSSTVNFLPNARAMVGILNKV